MSERRGNQLTFDVSAREHGRTKKIHFFGNKSGTATMNVNVSDEEVTGTLSDPSGQTLQIENGKIEGNQLTFDVSAREHGRTKKIHFFGQVTDDLITLHNQSQGKQGQTMTSHRIRD